MAILAFWAVAIVVRSSKNLVGTESNSVYTTYNSGRESTSCRPCKCLLIQLKILLIIHINHEIDFIIILAMFGFKADWLNPGKIFAIG